jgi:hypothetical protein
MHALDRVHVCAALIVMLCAAACSGGGEAGAEARKPAPPAPPEHVVSELAQLMRDMTAFADSTKARLGRGEDLLPYPAGFSRMTTATPTPGMVDHRTYDPFAFAYLKQLDSLYKVPAAARKEVFNGLISSCAACHGQVCPGPLVRINKLHLPRPAKPAGA